MRRLLLQQLSRLVSTRQAGNHVQCRNMNLKATKKDVQAIAHERVPVQDVRNFSIVSHIDAGKSTLSDALMARCGAIDTSKANSQFLDRLQVERERGITVKAQAASVLWNEHLFNLIDTPGHVDFSGEVARSLKACDGVLLLVDATQGVQAQTVTNLYLALEADLPVVPVLNKCDAATADITGSSQQMVSICGVQPDEIICVSAKHGTGIDNVLDAVQNRIPAPLVHENSSTARALLLDSFYNSYRGAITLALVKDGSIQAGSRIASLSTGEQHTVAEVGMFTPDATVTRSISAARLGYLVTGARSPQAARIGDTICSPPEAMQTAEPLASLPSTKPSVWQGIFPSSSDEYEKLRRGIAQLTMNDASVSVDHESSEALGLGFRAGFLGVLHADVFRQRLQEETGIHVICTAPTVPYQCRPRKEGAEWQTVRNPSQLEEIKHYEGTSVEMQEPVVEATILLPSSRLGAVLNLASEYRAKALEQSFLSSDRVLLRYDVPLSEMPPFTEKLKQITSGWASLDYSESNGYRPCDADVLSILVNKQRVDPLSAIVTSEKAQEVGRHMCKKLKENLQRHAFEVRIQAMYGASRIVSSESLAAGKKDVTAKLYGGDFTRKQKLLERQKEGQAKARKVGQVTLDHAIFRKVLKQGT